MTKATGFGSSTRADWEGTRMNKRDMNNPNAGPASYDITTECILSDSTKRRPRRQVRALATPRPAPAHTRPISLQTFSVSQRVTVDVNRRAPGPQYNYDGELGGPQTYYRGPVKPVLPRFNVDHRKPLLGNSSTDALQNPPLMADIQVTRKCVQRGCAGAAAAAAATPTRRPLLLLFY